MEKRYFAGGNTKHGFYSYFHNILPREQMKRVFILKGGSGVGKSSLMKKFGKDLKKKGYDVVYIHCASDENSLDGVCVEELGLLMLDGTAPHVVEPVMPGVVEEVLCLGQWLDADSLTPFKDEIGSYIKEKSRLYKVAYGYLEMAGILEGQTDAIYDANTNYHLLGKKAQEIADSLFLEEKGKQGTVRHLFSEAFTSSGMVDYSNTLVKQKNVIQIFSESPLATTAFLEKIAAIGVEKGYDMESYCYGIDPKKKKHLLIPSLDTIITCSQGSITSTENVVSLNQYIDFDEVKRNRISLAENESLRKQVLDLAQNALKNTKLQHQGLETIYSNAMDFEKVNELAKELFAGFSKKGGDA